jgi:hypothetical protein
MKIAPCFFSAFCFGFNASLRIAVVSGIWNEGEFNAHTFKLRLIVFEVPLSASFWLSVMRDVKSRFFEACC